MIKLSLFIFEKLNYLSICVHTRFHTSFQVLLIACLWPVASEVCQLRCYLNETQIAVKILG